MKEKDTQVLEDQIAFLKRILNMKQKQIELRDQEISTLKLMEELAMKYGALC